MHNDFKFMYNGYLIVQKSYEVSGTILSSMDANKARFPLQLIHSYNMGTILT